MLGVLSLSSDSVASATTTKTGNYGGEPTMYAGTALGNEGIVWAGGGNYLAVVVPTGEEVITFTRRKMTHLKISYAAPTLDDVAATCTSQTLLEVPYAGR